MVRLTKAQRGVFAEKLPDLATLLAGGFLVGQFLSDAPVSIALLLFAGTVWVVLMGLAILLAPE